MPSLLQAAFVTASPYGWMLKRWRRYGDVFSSRFPIFGRVVYVADPALVKEVFTGDAVTFHAGEANTLALGDALGEHSLLTLDEERHMSQRKLLLPPFHGKSVRRYVEVMAEATEREVASWPVGKEIELRPRMQAITLDVILRAVFGVRDDRRMDLFRERIPPLGEMTSVLNWLPFMERDLGGITPAARFRRALAAVDELIYAEIAERRAACEDDQDDVLSLLLRARHEDCSPMTDTAARRAHDAPDRGARDDRDRAGLGLRAPAPHAARAGAADQLARRRRLSGRGGEGDAARAPGDRGRGEEAHARDRGRGLAAARRDPRAAGDRGAARAPGPVRVAFGVPAGALP
jgi:hypothetical protein